MNFAEMILTRRNPKMLQLNDPAMTAPPGMHSNFVNPSDLKTEGLILMIFCLTASTLVVAMRMWTKCRLLHKMTVEDCSSTRPQYILILFTDFFRGVLCGAGTMTSFFLLSRTLTKSVPILQ